MYDCFFWYFNVNFGFFSDNLGLFSGTLPHASSSYVMLIT